MKILELFSGTEGISNEFRKRGHDAYTVDWGENFQPSLSCDIENLTSEEILSKFGRPDVIFAAFDCSTFSMLAMRKHRRKNHETGEMDAVSEYAKKCDRVDKHVLQLINELKPKVFIIENPRGGLRTMRWMQGIPRYTTTYCKYGAKYQKPTDFWSNIDLQLLPPCKAGSPCHEPSRGYSQTGLLGIADKKARSMYPQLLIEHLVDICEKYVA